MTLPMLRCSKGALLLVRTDLEHVMDSSVGSVIRYAAPPACRALTSSRRLQPARKVLPHQRRRPRRIAPP